MPETPEITEFLLSGDEPIGAGDDVRVRPWAPPAPAHGQGTNRGPSFDGVRFAWGQPLTVVEGEADLAAGTVSLEIVKAYPASFMTEARYHEYQNLIS